jgi:hypothetical protein
MESTPPINPTPEAAPKSNRNLIIGIVIAVVLCCCCVVTGAAGYYGYQAYTAAQQAVQQFDDIQIPDIQDIPTGIPIDPNNLPVDLGDVPQGGLSDDTTRYSAWLSVQLVGMMSGCEAPTAATTTISVTQQPDASGVWVEAWNVDCGNGSFTSYNITFTPENGVVNPTVELP